MPARDQVLQIRLTPSERQQLEHAAKLRGWTMAQLLRDFIRQLPAPPNPPASEDC